MVATSLSSEFEESFENRFPKSGSNDNYCVLKSLNPTQFSASVLRSYTEFVIKEGWNSLLFSCQTGGILRIDPKAT
jgi:hypothetical protein